LKATETDGVIQSHTFSVSGRNKSSYRLEFTWENFIVVKYLFQ